ncbi:phage portal protein [Streptomyces zhihengii]
MDTKDLAGGVYTSVSYAGVTNIWGTQGRADGWDLERVIVEGYERSIWTFKAVEAISKHASTLAVQIGRGGDEREFDEVLEDHPLLRLLNKQANPLETGDVFKRVSAQLLLSKKGVFIEKTYSRGGVLVRLDILPPDRVRVVPDDVNASYIKHFEFTDNAGVVRELEPGTSSGSATRTHRSVLRRHPARGGRPIRRPGREGPTYNISFIDNDGRPGGIVGIDLDGVDAKEVDRIQRRLAQARTTPGNSPSSAPDRAASRTSIPPPAMRDGVRDPLQHREERDPERVRRLRERDRQRQRADVQQRRPRRWNFWDHTELPHLRLFASAFDPDLSDDWQIRFNTAGVQALAFPAARHARKPEPSSRPA